MSLVKDQVKQIYIGPDRRTRIGDRRQYNRACTAMSSYFLSGGAERRWGPDRRQEALTGVVTGLSASELIALRELWELSEQ